MLRQKQRGFRGDSQLATNQLIYAILRNVYCFRQFHLSQSQRFEKFLQQDLSRMS
jgi:hypothetical protein